MKKINKILCYFLTLIFGLLAFWLGDLFFKESIDFELFSVALFGLPAVTYLVYALSPIKKIYAYISAFLSNIIINAALFWRIFPDILYYETKCSQGHEAIPDIVIDAYILVILPIVLNALVFSLIYLIIHHIQKIRINKKKLRKTDEEINENTGI